MSEGRELPSVHWFGKSWQAPVCDPETKIEWPRDELCAKCGNVFGDEGVQGLALPYVDPIAREIAKPDDEEIRWDWLYFHRPCFMELIGVKKR